ALNAALAMNDEGFLRTKRDQLDWDALEGQMASERHHILTHKVRSLLGLCILAVACSSAPSPAAPKCTPGQTAACACPTGQMGAQTCDGDGRFAACDCEISDGSSATNGDADSESSSAPKCTPGQSFACACLTGQTGAQTCGGDGRFAACDCATSDGSLTVSS